MTFFVDTNVIIYAAVPGSAGGACSAVLAAISRGNAEGRTSAAVLEEVWHLELSGKAGEIAGLTEATYELFSPLLSITDDIVAKALASPSYGLGANDRIHVATCTDAGIATMLTADRGFERVTTLTRVDPLDDRELERLIGSR